MICNETYRMNSCAITISALTLVYFMLVILVRRDIVVLIQIPYATLRVHQGPSTACNSYSNRHTFCTILPRIENVLLTITLPQAQLLICKDKMFVIVSENVYGGKEGTICSCHWNFTEFSILLPIMPLWGLNSYLFEIQWELEERVKHKICEIHFLGNVFISKRQFVN